MQSKILCFNRTLFRKNLTRFWPLWALPSFVGALFPMVVLTQALRYGDLGMEPLSVTQIYYGAVHYAVPILSLCYAILVALAVWSYLFNNRSVGLMHTLPIRREGLFCTNFLSGMAMMLIPYAVTGGLAILIFACLGGFDPVGTLVTILAVIGESLFYFASATLVCFVTANLFAAPVLYFVFHFLASGLDLLLNVFANGFLFGVTTGYTGAVEYLSPTLYLIHYVESKGEHERVFISDPVYGDITADGVGYYSNRLTSVYLENWHLIAIYALVGVVLLAAAYGLYRRHRSESAGDVVAVGWMKPVFRCGVTLCGAMAGGLALYAIFWSSFQSGSSCDVVPMAICMAIAGLICYYTASMLLAKSLRVFRGSWKGVLATLVCVIAICCTLHFDLLGIETRVPTADQVKEVSLYVAENHYDLDPVRDAALLEEVRAVHLAVAQSGDYIDDLQENWQDRGVEDQDISTYNGFRLTYTLKNGTTVSRRYYVPILRERLDQEGTYDYALDQLVNSEALKARRFHLDDDFEVEAGSIYVQESMEPGISFGTREARTLLEAVRKDVAAGVCGDYNWFDQDRGSDYALELTLEFQRPLKNDLNGDPYYEGDHIAVRVRPGMTNTVNCLLALDLVEPDELKTYRELYPQDYDEDYLLWEKGLAEETYAYPAEAYDMPAYPSESIGVIGGADGPTAVVVGTTVTTAG